MSYIIKLYCIINHTSYSYSSKHESHFSQVYFKPFIWGIAYINGIIFGYIMETNGLNVFQNNSFVKRIVNLSKIALIGLLSISILLLIRGVYSFNLNRLESNLVPLFSSIIMMDFVIKINEFEFFRKIVYWSGFLHLKHLTRAIYLLNPIVSNLIASVMPFEKFPHFDFDSNLSSKLILPFLTYLAFITVLYFLSVISVVVFEIPLNVLFDNLNKLLFAHNANKLINVKSKLS